MNKCGATHVTAAVGGAGRGRLPWLAVIACVALSSCCMVSKDGRAWPVLGTLKRERVTTETATQVTTSETWAFEPSADPIKSVVAGAVSVAVPSPWPAVADAGSKGLSVGIGAVGSGVGKTVAAPGAVADNLTTRSQ